jgi:hypothetical protein
MCLSTISHAIVMVHLFNGSVLILMTRGQTNYFCFEDCSLTTFLYFTVISSSLYLQWFLTIYRTDTSIFVYEAKVSSQKRGRSKTNKSALCESDKIRHCFYSIRRFHQSFEIKILLILSLILLIPTNIVIADDHVWWLVSKRYRCWACYGWFVIKHNYRLLTYGQPYKNSRVLSKKGTHKVWS